MSFIKTATSTLYSPAFYNSLKEKSLRGAFGYFAKLALFLAFFGAILSGVFFAPVVSELLSDLQKEILSYYPAGLELKIENGVATSNSKNEPLFFPINENWKKIPQAGDSSDTSQKNVPDYFFVLYTAADNDLTIDSFKKMKTYSLLTSRHFVAYDSNGGVVFRDLSDFGKATINQDTILRIFALSRFLPVAIPLLYFVFIFFGVFFLSIFLLFVAMVFLIIQSILKNGLTFKQAYIICLYASTAPIILSTLFVLAGLSTGTTLSLLTLTTLLVALMNSKHPQQPEVSITNSI